MLGESYTPFPRTIGVTGSRAIGRDHRTCEVGILSSLICNVIHEQAQLPGVSLHTDAEITDTVGIVLDLRISRFIYLVAQYVVAFALVAPLQSRVSVRCTSEVNRPEVGSPGGGLPFRDNRQLVTLLYIKDTVTI